MSSETFVDTYIPDARGKQNAFKTMPSSNGDFEKPGEKEKLILLSYAKNGTYGALLDEVFDLAGAGRSQRINDNYIRYAFQFEEVKPVQPAITPVKTTTIVSKNSNSREQRKLAQAIQAELYRMIGIGNKPSGNIRTDIADHRNNELKDYKKMVFALIDDATPEILGLIDQLSINDVFTPLFGKVSEEKISLSRKHLAAADLLTARYQETLFSSPGEIDEAEISNSLKENVLQSVATEIAKVFEEPVSEVKKQLEPEYAGALDAVKMLIFGKE